MQARAGRRVRSWLRLCGSIIGAGGFIDPVLRAVVGEPVLTAMLITNDLPIVVLGAFWIWGAPALLTSVNARQLRRVRSGDAGEFESLTFTAAGFSPSSEWSKPMPWSFVDDVIETKRFLLIYHGYSKEPYYIPKHALSTTDLNQLKDVMRENLKSSAQRHLPEASERNTEAGDE